MLKHNLLIIFRNLKRHKSTFIINLIGLSTGLACALLIYLWVNDELSIDKFHEKDNQLYQVMSRNENANGIEVGAAMPPVLMEALVDEMPEVEYAASEAINPFKNTLSVNDKYIKASGAYADKDYFNIFSYKLIEGNKNQVLLNENNILISEKLSKKFFNNTQNITGRFVKFDDKGEFLISGIFSIPKNSSNQFDFILHFNVQFKFYPNLKDDWTSNSWANTYVVLKEGTDLTQFNSKIQNLIERKTKEEHISLFVRPYSEAYLYGSYENGVQAGGRIEYVKIFSIIATFILLIASINFMNLSTAKASGRLKEIGIKKALGVKRKTLILQYLSESIIISFISLAAAMLITELSLPYFNEITGKQISLNYNTSIMLSFLAITLFTGLISGSYPALYLSGFKPIAILKGKLNTSYGELLTRKGLIVFQFILSVMFIVGVLVVYKQMELIQNKNLGYNKDNIIYFEMEGKVKENLDAFLSEIKKIPGVKNASSIWYSFLGITNSTSDVSWEGKDSRLIVDMHYRRVNYDMIELLDLKMKEGTAFSRSLSSIPSKIIFNETAIEKMGIEDPVGKKITLWGREFEILGVINNFYFESLHENVKPLFMFLNPERTNTVMVKIEQKAFTETIDKLKDFHNSFTQGLPLDFKFLDEVFQTQYAAEKRVAALSRIFAGLAVLISCLGLLGLASFTAQRRIKEIGIRKVLGSSEFGIIYLLSSDFTKLVIVSIIIALPVSYFLVKNWLDSFAYTIELNLWYFAAAGLITLMVAWLTVGIQAFKAASINPSECLRYE